MGLIPGQGTKIPHAVAKMHHVDMHKSKLFLRIYYMLIFIPIPKKGNAKECSNYCTIALLSHASKVTLKILQVGFNSTLTVNFQMFKLDLERAEEPEIKLTISTG